MAARRETERLVGTSFCDGAAFVLTSNDVLGESVAVAVGFYLDFAHFGGGKGSRNGDLGW